MSNRPNISQKQIELEVEAISMRYKRADSNGDSWLYRGYDERYDHEEETWILRGYEVDMEFAWIMLIDLLDRLGHRVLFEFAQKEYNNFKEKPTASVMGPDEPYLIWPARLRLLITIIKDIHLPDRDSGSSDIEIEKLKLLIKNTEYYITQTSVFSWAPCVEEDVHNRIEGILKCAYPDLKRKPPLAKTIKGFVPDTGIPSLKTFIEYKFINNQNEGKAVLDEIFSDISGYKDQAYNRYIFVIYETGRVFNKIDWEEAIASAQAKESIDVIVLQGSPFTDVDKVRREKAMESRSQSAKKHLKGINAKKSSKVGVARKPSRNNSKGPVNPLFPALRSGHRLFQRPSHKKQIPSSNIALKLAPYGKATAYLGTNAFCSGVSAAIAPIVGGIIGSYFAIKENSINLSYRANAADLENVISIPAMSLRGIDFIFLTAALVGFYALHRLSLIQEEGSVSEAEVRDELFSSVRNSLVNTSGLSMGMRRMTAFPYEMLRKTSRSTSSTIYRAAKTGVKHAKGTIRKPHNPPGPPEGGGSATLNELSHNPDCFIYS